MPSTIKAQLYKFCLTTIEQKLNTINQVLSSAQNSANQETKSTAGDKHDTARAMAHLESEKNNKQLVEINKLKKVLPYLKAHRNNDIVELGSLVETDDFKYYISISLGLVTIDNTNYITLSPVTPIGKLLVGKKVGDFINFNGKKHTIKHIL